jgi:hypothetical protein
LENSVLPAACGLAAPEFEAWLIADHVALCAALKMSVDPPVAPEAMVPGGAKAYLVGLLNRAGFDALQCEAARREIASNCNLETLRRVRAVEELIKDVARILAR